MYSSRPMVPALMTLIVAALLGGCVRDTKPATFYLLGPAAPPAAERIEGPRVIVGPVEFPRYLDRPQIVTRHSEGRIDIDEFARWAEPLNHTVPSVIAENISALTGGTRIVPFLQIREMSNDYRVVAMVSRFDTDETGNTVLDVKWSVLRPTDKSYTMARHSTYRSNTSVRDYEERVASMNALLLRWSEDIATEIRRMDSANP